MLIPEEYQSLCEKPLDQEKDILEASYFANSNSRLGCQVRRACRPIYKSVVLSFSLAFSHSLSTFPCTLVGTHEWFTRRHTTPFFFLAHTARWAQTLNNMSLSYTYSHISDNFEERDGWYVYWYSSPSGLVYRWNASIHGVKVCNAARQLGTQLRFRDETACAERVW